ncbi:MAG: tRNA (N(6)-L-threonylcarbamoyladenosine(37)-C(2))-methylthiotransferase MtaB [Clostridia bacterium]|nr:tRNA (N(6)-L-threonylcarbamoyladenosine(37)-C(2))-methylthiotransferase MtaB [Clostridia bacterium]
MKVVVFNIGCKVNQYECDAIMDMLRDMNYEVSSELTYADLYIINTCAVTAEAEKKSRQCYARCKHINPNSKIMIIGCSSQNNPNSFIKDDVIFIGGTNKKKEIINHLNDLSLYTNDLTLPNEYEELSIAKTDRARGYIKIQDGCNKFCSYCLIPYVRGRSHSRRIDSVLEEFNRLSKVTNEIVLIGVDLMEYGKDNNQSLIDLFNELKNFDIRIRLGSLYAENLTEELLDSMFNLKRFCPHFHLSLQSGDDEILKLMNRHYNSKVYSDKISIIRSYDYNSCITTDVIVGFPTETNIQFENTYKFLKDNKFSDIHVFPYSKRNGTIASKYIQVDKNIVKERMNKLLDLKNDLKKQYVYDNINEEQEILIEYKNEDGYYEGYSRNYIRIYTNNEDNLRIIKNLKPYKDGLIEI